MMPRLKYARDPRQRKQLIYLKEIKQFTQTLQLGDLGLSDLIDYGFCLYGKTKTGKTVTGHIFAGNPVKGSEQNVVQTMTSRNQNAKIGPTGNSQTLIPNFFDVKINTKKYSDKSKMCVVDTPGYGDSLGIYRILSIGYFHYRLYSRIKNMKFILCFDRQQLNNDAKDFINTIKQFTSYFNNYLDIDIKDQIWKSCAFLITKVDQSENTQKDLCQKLQNLAQTLILQCDEDVDVAIRGFIHYMVDNQRVFYIKKIRIGQASQQKGLLQKIDNKIQWYKRNISQKNINQVDMTPISFNLAKQIILSITEQNKSQNQFSQLIQYYNRRIQQFVQDTNVAKQIDKNDKGSLGYVINQLVKDTIGKPDSHQFLNYMQNYKKKYYDPSYQNRNNERDTTYKYLRQKKQKQLFSNLNLKDQKHSSFSKKDKYNQKCYIVKKFDALLNIQKLKKQINRQTFIQNRLQWFDKCQKNIYSIIKQFNNVSYKKSKCQTLIYKYGYVIHRIIEQAKVITNLLEVGCKSQQNKKRLLQNGKNVIDFVSPLRDFMGIGFSVQNQYLGIPNVIIQKDPVLYQHQKKTRQKQQIKFQNSTAVKSYTQLSSEALKKIYIQKFDLNNAIMKNNLVINQSLINFFANVKFQGQNDQIIQKNIQLTIEFSDQILNDNEQFEDNQQILLQQKKKLIERLSISRMNCEILYQLKHHIEQQKDKCIMMIRKITMNLGKLLQSVKRYQTAKKVYDSINFVSSVCRIYRQQIKINPNDLDLRIKFARYLTAHFKENEAIDLLLQTNELITDFKKKKQVKAIIDQILQVRTLIKEKKNSLEFQTFLFNENYFIQYNQELESQVQNKKRRIIQKID